MTKINVSVNPFTMVAKISARIDNTEERAEVIFSPYDFGSVWYPFNLGNKSYDIKFTYDGELFIEIEDAEDGTSQAVKFEIVKK
jgi:hypothetical protein